LRCASATRPARAAANRGGVLRGAQQLRHDRAQQRDRRARQQVSGKLQLELYAACEDLLLDRIVWFVRNVESRRGSPRWSSTIAPASRRSAALDTRAAARAAARRARRRADRGRRAGGPGARIANLRALAAAPDIVSVADRTGKASRDVAATYFAAGASSSSTASRARRAASR
jgi:NAD-specific glutamate dehydrogenase